MLFFPNFQLSGGIEKFKKICPPPRKSWNDATDDNSLTLRSIIQVTSKTNEFVEVTKLTVSKIADIQCNNKNEDAVNSFQTCPAANFFV